MLIEKGAASVCVVKLTTSLPTPVVKAVPLQVIFRHLFAGVVPCTKILVIKYFENGIYVCLGVSVAQVETGVLQPCTVKINNCRMCLPSFNIML